MQHIIKYLAPILLYLNNTSTTKKNHNKNGKFFEDNMKQKDKRENLMKALFSKRCLQHAARGKLTLTIVPLAYPFTCEVVSFPL